MSNFCRLKLLLEETREISVALFCEPLSLSHFYDSFLPQKFLWPKWLQKFLWLKGPQKCLRSNESQKFLRPKGPQKFLRSNDLRNFCSRKGLRNFCGQKNLRNFCSPTVPRNCASEISATHQHQETSLVQLRRGNFCGPMPPCIFCGTFCSWLRNF